MQQLPREITRPLVAPSVLASDFGRMAEESADVMALGADFLHVDIMDGHFVRNLSMGPDNVKALRQALPDVLLDVHLMVERPDLFAKPFADAGASHISFHLEVTSPFHAAGIDGHKLIDEIHAMGLTAGMVVNPYTDPSPLEMFWDKLELVLVMSVVPGYGGQAFLEHTLEKTRWLHENIPSHVRLEVDGGMTPETAPQAVEAGIDTLVAGSSIFRAKDRKAVIDGMHALPLRARG